MTRPPMLMVCMLLLGSGGYPASAHSDQEHLPSISPYFYFPAQAFDNLDQNPAILAEFSEAYSQFLAGESFRKWPQDRGWRITAPLTIVVTSLADGQPQYDIDYAGTHPIVKVFYSPGIYEWLMRGRKGDLSDGEIIIKEQAYVPKLADSIIAKLIAEHRFPEAGKSITLSRDGLIPKEFTSGLTADGFPSMIKVAKGAFDGWFWGDWGKDHRYPYYGRSAYSEQGAANRAGNPDANPIPVRPDMNWFGGGKGPSYPTGDWSGEVVFPMDGFGGYCLNCHASAARESTFSDLANMVLSDAQRKRAEQAGVHIEPPIPFDLIVRYQPALGDRPMHEVVDSDSGIHSDDPSDDEHNLKYTQLAPLSVPNPAFQKAFGTFFPKGVSWESVWTNRFPAQSYDHVVAQDDGNGHNGTTFLTSDQCVGCHSAAVAGPSPANMEFPHVTKKDITVDLSPYGEWQTSLMGLAGRDPVFFAQVQSEAWYYRDNPDIYGLMLDTCLFCHGAMGRRQWSEDGRNAMELAQRDPDKFFPRDMVNAYPYHAELAADSRYGSLAREGISCMVCHTMDGKVMGIVEDEGHRFFKGTSTFSYNRNGRTIFGPYDNDDIREKPMQQGLGITPQQGEQLSRAQLCGSCHVVRLPIFKAVDGRPVKRGPHGHMIALKDLGDRSNPGTDVDGRPVTSDIRSDGLGYGDRIYEQTTYFEWQNSVYNDETIDPLTGQTLKPSLEARNCQSCHMPRTYHGKRLATKIANIQDSDLADVHGRLPGEEITLSKQQPFSRHSLNGINLFVLEMFQQFPLILGTQQMNYQNSGQVQGPYLTTREHTVDFSRHESAAVTIKEIKREGQTLVADVAVENLAGHFLPSGVSFRRAWLELSVHDKRGRVLWASGQTNSVGQLVDMSGKVLPSELLGNPHQPHYQEVDSPEKVQIYEEVVKDTQGGYTSSFTGMWQSVKDNRLRPKGFDNRWQNPVADHLKAHGTSGDKDYEALDRPLWGGDRIRYRIDLGRKNRKAHQVRATLYYQSIPPRFLADKFSAAQGLAKAGRDTSDIERLFFLAGHLNTGNHGSEKSPIPNWKLKVDDAAVTLP